MIIIGCSHGKLAKNIAKRPKKPYSELNVRKFPDSELYLRYMKDVKGKIVVLVQSFYGQISDCIIEVLFAAKTARDLGAKKVFLIAPYFPYLRQDSRFNPGECLSIKVLSEMISDCFDKVFIIDPHLHRETDLHHLFSISSKKLTSNHYTAQYIKKNIKNPLIVGPDWESYKWARKVAEEIGCDHVILEKKRISGRKVKITLNKKINISGKNIIFVDDIISTGHTILEAAKNLRKLGAKKFICIGVHGIFVENALEKLKKANINVITTNTIPNKKAKIDISELIGKELE